MRFTVKSTTTLILASKSPRRIELMTLAGFDFLSVPAIKEEKITGGTSPSDAVLMLSRQKAEEIAEKYPYNTVIGADTVVALGNEIMGKPENEQDAFNMLKKQSGITQEQLAAKLGVTTQAVSKWENGSYPDGDLLPKIADIFDVSIDNLYGRGEKKCSFEQQVVNHMRAIADSNQDSCAEWLKSYLNIIWAMQLTAWRENRYYYDLPDFKDSNGTIASECACNTGVTYMRLNKDFRYFTCIEQPESFAKQFSDIDKLSELFRFLGDKMNLKVVMYLLSLDNGEVVSASTIAIHLGYPKEKIEKALQYLLSINSTNKEVLEISVLRPDNHTEKVYGVRNFMPEMIVLLTGAYAVLNQPHGYRTSVNNRDYPFFDRKDMSFIKMGEKNEEK